MGVVTCWYMNIGLSPWVIQILIRRVVYKKYVVGGGGVGVEPPPPVYAPEQVGQFIRLPISFHDTGTQNTWYTLNYLLLYS